MPLAITTDVEHLLQVDFTNEPDPHVAAAIATATALVEAEIGCPLVEATVTAWVSPVGGYRVWLPRWFVSDVASLLEDGITLVEGDHFVWEASGALYRVDGQEWTHTRQGVEVEFTAGFADHTTVPAQLRALIAQVASRIWQYGYAHAVLSTEGVAGVEQEAIGGYSVTYGDAASNTGEASKLTEDEVRAARKWRRSRAGMVHS